MKEAQAVIHWQPVIQGVAEESDMTECTCAHDAEATRWDRVSASLLLNSGNEGSRNSPADIRMFVVITPGVVHCDG